MAEEEEEDIISTLPDPILCHILSSLETKQSVATSALSKRWKNLHLSVPTLRFNGQVTDHLTNFQFNDFVYSVLLPRDAAFPVKTFHFDVTYDDDPIQCPIDSITKWVNFVVQRKLEYLHLSVGSMGLPKLPTTILTCKTLVVLKLFYFSVEEGYSSVVLPSLKTLHLEYIWFPQLRDFMIFLTGCPNLEDLVTYDVSFDSDESLTCNEWNSFCLTNLIRADVDCYHYCFPFKAVHNVLSLRFEIDQVHYCNDLIPNFQNLTQLELISLDYSWRFLIEVLNHCPKLQKLDLDQADLDKETWTKKDDKENWVDPVVVPQCLSLHLRTCDLFNFLGLQSEILFAKYILKNARVLQTMTIGNVGQTQIKRLISSCPKASAACKITIYRQRLNKTG